MWLLSILIFYIKTSLLLFYIVDNYLYLPIKFPFPDSKFSIHLSFRGSVCLLGCLAWKISIVFPFQWNVGDWLLGFSFVYQQFDFIYTGEWHFFLRVILEHQSSSFTPLIMSRCPPTSVMRNQLSIERKPFEDNLCFLSLAPSKIFPTHTHEFNCDVSGLNFCFFSCSSFLC